MPYGALRPPDPRLWKAAHQLYLSIDRKRKSIASRLGELLQIFNSSILWTLKVDL